MEYIEKEVTAKNYVKKNEPCLRCLSPENYPKIFELSKQLGVQIPDIFVIDSESLQAYAWPSIKITNGLIKFLSQEELFSAILHEIGHRMSEWGYRDYLLISMYFLSLLVFPVIWGISALIAVRVIFAAIICWIQRKSELRADLYAARILGDNKEWLVSAIKKTGDALKHTNPTIFDRLIYYALFWPFRTHPSVEERIKKITHES